ncbi:amidohydrolase [Lysinibacillus capsici]|uniref:amidohydrolase n=1 Tax=Lysinibacillus capsici TaxID=2115968 RepID=UPI0028E564F0|nr:amidohydrolase [uncultured Lysinibacillus sp.]
MMKIICNAKIYTADTIQPSATAMVIEGGKILWIGQQEDLPPYQGEIIDVQGKVIIPGIIDAHMHPIMLADVLEQVACLPPYIYSIEDIINALANYDASQRGWLLGWGYDEGKLKERRAPLKEDLDRASTELPVIVMRTCGHIISVNSKALAIAGITKDTLDPQGGQIDRDENGEPTGVLRENARNLVLQHLPTPSEEEIVKRLLKLSQTLASYGVTSITELMATVAPIDYLGLYRKAREKGFKQRVAVYYIWEDIQRYELLTANTIDRSAGAYIGGIKLFSDGSVSGRTALVSEPFLGSDEKGIAMTSKEELLAAAAVAKEYGIQLVVHAMGDRAIDLIVDTFYEEKAWLTDAPSVRIEHAAMPSKSALQKAAEWGIGFVPQPIFLFCEIESYLENLGLEKTQTLYGVQTFLKRGIATALSSDAPATSWAEAANPFVTIQAAVTRTAYDGTDLGTAEKISVEEALQLYTVDAKTMIRMENVGQLKEGYEANFVVLTDDLLTLSHNQLMHVKPFATYIEGECVFTQSTIQAQ